LARGKPQPADAASRLSMSSRGSTAPVRQAPHVLPAAPSALFVTVGTDGTYSFDRLVDWTDEWLCALDGAKPPTLVQHGISQPARFAPSRDFLSHDAMVAAIESASLIVTHGGPATIFECWRFHKRPVVVPRRKALREAVDDHQTLFLLSESVQPRVWIARTKPDFVTLLSTISRHPSLSHLSERTEPPVTQTIAKFEAVLADLVRR
jgi:UDP-N-acetylglucosamine transferase subunit ALG13